MPWFLLFSLKHKLYFIVRELFNIILLKCFQQHHEGITTGHNRMTEWMEAYAEAHNPLKSTDSRIVHVIILSKLVDFQAEGPIMGPSVFILEHSLLSLFFKVIKVQSKDETG